MAIVGEGITEWHYFSSMRVTEKFPFKVSPELPKHSSVDSIIKKALSLVEVGVSKVYCVLDLDTICNSADRFQKYNTAKNKAIKKSNGKIEFIESMPCIELWFLLHFCDYSAKEYANYDEIEPQLKRFLVDYEKTEKYFSTQNFYKKLLVEGSIDTAIESCRKLSDNYDPSMSITSPRSKMYELCCYLKSQRK